MIFDGLTDSAASVAGETLACRRCGSTARIANGLCVSCMLEPALEGDGDGGESFAAVLAEIDVRDTDWRAGNYQILEEIGRGGMGVIYRARQRHSRRIVALKRVLSYHADSRETLARFRREAEAAASLDHPNILPIYEVSEGEDGLPFFSMKFAPGGSLLEVAPALRDEPRRSVALMAKVARAVQYAHDQGILHRDLKPGNILLDGRGEPLVSDFGLAKWLDTTSDVTRTLTIFGTPGYIAPEQARGPGASLTPAADVYSLGAILFTLFTGRPPFLGEHALAVIQQASEKPAPSLRSLIPGFDRDLETICAKCLERETDARYRSAGDLVEDLEHWLQGRPIKTRRVLPSTRAWRWSRRNPVLVGTAGVCLLLGAASIWVLRQSVPARQISSATRKAPLSPQEAAEQSKLRQALVAYPELQGVEEARLMEYPSEEDRVYSGLGMQVGFDAKLLRDKLPKFAETVKRDPAAPVYERASAAYFGKDYPEAERLSLGAAEEARKTGPDGTTNVIQALDLAGLSARKAGEFARANDHLRDAEKLTDLQRNPREWANIQYAIAKALLLEKTEIRASEAEKRIRGVIEVRARIFGPEHRETIASRRVLARSLLSQAKSAEAEAEYREILKLEEKMFGPGHLEALLSAWDLAEAKLDYNNNKPDGIVEERHVLELSEEVLGPESPYTLNFRDGVAGSLAELGHFPEAIGQFRELVKMMEKVFGPEDDNTINSLMNLGVILGYDGKYAEAEAILRRVVRIRQKTLGPADFYTLLSRSNLAWTLAAQDKPFEAEAECRDLVKINDETVGAERSGWARDVLGVMLDKQGKHVEAEAEIRQGLRLNDKTQGRKDIYTRRSRGHLAMNLWYQGKNAEAETELRELIPLNEEVLGGQAYSLQNNVHPRLREGDLTPLTSRTLLANTLRDQQKYAEAEVEYNHVIQLEEKVLGSEHHDTLNACYNFAYQLGQQGKISQAKTLAKRAAKGATKVLGANDPNTREYLKFFEILENGQPITTPYIKFHEIFVSGTRGEQAPRA
jgi:serine/threonine protein kinase/tetratricopeptide (TPR) repeat protein